MRTGLIVLAALALVAGVAGIVSGGGTDETHAAAAASGPARYVAERRPAQGAGRQEELSAWRLAPGGADGERGPAASSPFTNPWQLQATLGGVVIKDISFPTAQVGYIAAELGRVWKTTDGGAHWASIMNLGFPYYWYGVHALDANNVVISGFINNAQSGVIRRSQDGGATWSPDIALTTRGWSFRVRFADALHGLVLDGLNYDAPNAAHYTTNGGPTPADWTAVVPDPAGGWFGNQFSLLPSLKARAAGITYCTSLDLGATWSCRPSVDPVFDGAVFFADDQHGWVGGGSISPSVEGWAHRTTDGGATWSGRTLNNPWPIRELRFVSDQVGWAAGGNIYSQVGGMYHTSDGGQTWSPDANTGAEMDACDSLDTGSGIQVWCAGYTSAFNGVVYTLHLETATPTATSEPTGTPTEIPTQTQTPTTTATPCSPAWHIVSSPNVGTGGNRLAAISAVSADDIWAVGSHTESVGYSRTLTEHWDGSQWSVVPSPNGGPNGEANSSLAGVTAVSANDVWAVGVYCCTGSRFSGTLTMRWDGTRWSIVPSPSPSLVAGLAAVSASSATDVWAVGVSGVPAFYPLVMRWDGTQWNASGAGVAKGNLTAVSVISANDVWVAGYMRTGSASLIAHWDGTGWSQVSSPNIGTINGVSGHAANDVWAVGANGIIHWDGSGWSISTTEFGGLNGVSMVAANDVWAVGGNRIIHWDGTGWSAVPGPGVGALNGVTAVSATNVWAAGATNNTDVEQTLVEHRNSDSFFEDVRPADYFYTPVNYLYCHGVISGYADGYFRPYNNTTRGQLAKIVVLAEGWTIYTPPTPTFRDVPTTDPFYAVIETAYSHGIISGYNCGPNCLEYRPGNNVTRAQLCKIIVLAENWEITPPGTPTFRDVPKGDPFYGYIETAYSHSIISGYSCGNGCLEFRPGNNATRGQICKIVYLAVTQP